MNELQNLIKNSVKNPSYFQQLNINDFIGDSNIKDELLNILQIIVTNSTKQTNQLKNYIDDIGLNLENRLNDLDDKIKEINNKLISSDIYINSINSKIESNKVIETLNLNTIKIALIEKDFKLAQNKYDKIFLDNMFIPNIISRKGTRFKNLKELISSNYEEISKIILNIEKLEKNVEVIKEKQSSVNNYLALKKMQDFVEQRTKMIEDTMNASLKEHINYIDKENEVIIDELKKKKEEFDESLDSFKKNMEDNFDAQFNNEHKLIEAQIINITQIKEFNKELIKKLEKLEKNYDNQKILIQKYIRYFELYKYRENYYLHKDIFNKEKKSAKRTKKLKEKKKKNNNLYHNKSIYDEEKNKITISFNEEDQIENLNLIRNNSVEIYNKLTNQENSKLMNFFNLINDKPNESNISNNNNENNLNNNSDLMINKKIEEKQKKPKLEDNDFGMLLTPFATYKDINEKINTFNFEKFMVDSNTTNNKNNDIIQLKKTNLFNFPKVTKLSVNSLNKNYSEKNFIKNNTFFLDGKIIKSEKNSNNNVINTNIKSNFNKKINNQNITNRNRRIENTSPLKINVTETSSYLTIDKYIDNKVVEIKKDNRTLQNKNIHENIYNNKAENFNKSTEEKKPQEKKFFKLNILKLDNINFNDFQTKSVAFEKKKENKKYKNTKIRIVSKSLPFKKEKNKNINIYDFTNSDYIKIIEKNKIKSVNTVKKFHPSKKNKI